MIKATSPKTSLEKAVVHPFALFLGLFTCAALAPREAAAITISGQTLSTTLITHELGGGADGTTVQFTLDAPGSVRLEVYDSVTTELVTTQDEAYATAGAKELFWPAYWLIGDEGGRKNGLYGLQLRASSGTLTDVKVVNPTVKIDSVDIHSVTLSPSLDAAGRPTFPYSISYALSKNSYVTIDVENSSGTLVRRLIENRLQEGEGISTHTITWNGLDQGGQAVPIGIYTAYLNARDPGYNSDAYTKSREIAVTSLAGASTDPKKAFDENVFVYPNPVRDGFATFSYVAVRENATITLKIFTINGDLVRSETFANAIPGAVKEFPWDLTNQSGRKVGRGLYLYVVREEDSAGVLQTTKKMAVIQ